MSKEEQDVINATKNFYKRYSNFEQYTLDSNKECQQYRKRIEKFELSVYVTEKNELSRISKF